MSNNVKLKNKCIFVVFVVILISTIAFFKFRNGNINYLNSNATWHVLLTMQSYDETSLSIHKFLPIVSLGNTEDKGIVWGETVADDKGNYYYTSFSPIGYILPYLFLEIFHMDMSEQSIYIFNTVLFAVSGGLWALFILQVFKKSKYAYVVAGVAVLTYAFAPELLHGMGIVYWHQSIMQVTLLIQIIAYHLMKEMKTKQSKIIFYIMCIINPYVEWTGYIANVGFIFSEMFLNRHSDKKKCLKNVLRIVVLTVVSFMIYVGHYLLVVRPEDLFRTLFSRFLVRSADFAVGWVDVTAGYLDSFLYLWVFVVILIVWNFMQNRAVTLQYGSILFILIFPSIENFVMKGHAVLYSYDRMKFVFFISFLICELVNNILNQTKNEKKTKYLIICIALFCGLLNLSSYVTSSQYMWKAEFREQNEKLADYINSHYSDSVVATESVDVRGYLNMLFHRGIYEKQSLDVTVEMAVESGKTYAVILTTKERGIWDMHALNGATIYDTKTSKEYTLCWMEGGWTETSKQH